MERATIEYGVVPIVSDPMAKPTAPRKPPKVTRYRPGVVPQFSEEVEKGSDSQSQPIERFEVVSLRVEDRHPLVVEDSRLTRLKQRAAESNLQRGTQRRIHEAEILHDESSPPPTQRHTRHEAVVIEGDLTTTSQEEHTQRDDSSDEDEMQIRRERARAKFQEEKEDSHNYENGDPSLLGLIANHRISTREEDESGEENSEVSDEGQSSEEAMSESEDDWHLRDVLQPVFVPSTSRDTKVEQAKIEKEKEKERLFEEKRKEERKKETLMLVEQDLRREIEEGYAQEEEHDEMADDPVNEEEEMKEYEAWKVRELARIRRTIIEKEQYLEEEKEKEKRSQMTDAEIRAIDSKTDKFQKKKTSMKFLQKYYHKGAFFQNMDDQVIHRDTSAPTGMDKIDKTLLPKVLQVKNFGRSGRTKYTHLVDQDTLGPAHTGNSMFEWRDDELTRKYLHKMGGTGSLEKKRKRT
jgi:microfibrillar-associated protein 1